ncbi:MAG: peptidylprolyl isomerase [Planctomycetes bacterium]|nr:peptidylprolyl isomerase [Planctomycetota bacterium]
MNVYTFARARLWVIVPFVALWSGCASSRRSPPPTMGSTWHDHATAGVLAEETENPTRESREPSLRRPMTAPSNQSGTQVANIAVVNGAAIPRHRVMYYLLKSRGPAVLEQLVVLDAAERMATDRGLTLRQADVDREYDLALQRISNPLAVVTAGDFDRTNAEELLRTVLVRRSISREEFMLGVRRNAYLRRIVESELAISEAQLRSAFSNRYGARIQVRHIQLATRAEVARVQDLLKNGAAFADLAKRYSANEQSAANGGLLDPFSLDDERVPAAFRTAAARLEDSRVSNAMRVGEWYHLLKLQRQVPPREVDFREVRDALERQLRAELAGPGMRQLSDRLFKEASIEINDPILREAFEKTFPDRGS